MYVDDEAAIVAAVVSAIKGSAVSKWIERQRQRADATGVGLDSLKAEAGLPPGGEWASMNFSRYRRVRNFLQAAGR
jgi:hypothetical protein